MASPRRRLPDNAPGDFFVDDSCIDCAACRWVAPASFGAAGGWSVVRRQPRDAAETERALMAALACPTGSIGFAQKHDVATAQRRWPERLDEDVYHCGYHAEASYGAASYLLRRPEGNVLVDSPRFTRPLVRRLDELGGVRWMVLTHRDDVADHARFAAHFGCERVMHRRDAGWGTRDVERLVEGDERLALDGDLVLIPTPGHTRGSMCLYAMSPRRVLFTGDHLAFSPERGHLFAFRDACWYDWGVQIASMRRLLDLRFEWVLPGHGWRLHAEAEAMGEQLRRCIAWMEER